jgi:F0F1-type ATP synthase membrane subunit c/vacuolar-type H+-ATPase subunit K
VAAAAWATQEPFDQRIFGCDYSDVAVLGKGITRGSTWRATGLAIHVVNGALFGLAFHEARRRVPVESRKLAVGMALAEHVALYPLCFLIDRFHPARGEPGVPPLATNGRAFAQATWRHALFGAVLSRLA